MTCEIHSLNARQCLRIRPKKTRTIDSSTEGNTTGADLDLTE